MLTLLAMAVTSTSVELFTAGVTLAGIMAHLSRQIFSNFIMNPQVR